MVLEDVVSGGEDRAVWSLGTRPLLQLMSYTCLAPPRLGYRRREGFDLPFSTHYYVLSLSERRNALFEAFRDSLVEVANQGFPVLGVSNPSDSLPLESRLELVREVDRRFDHYHTSEPLKLVVVGAPAMLVAFRAVTVHGDEVVGQIQTDHEPAGTRDLGQIVWPLVKEAMSGVLDGAMRDLHDLAQRGRVVSGLDAVAGVAGGQRQSTLLVEEDYHMRGSIIDAPRPPVISSEVDIRATIDDVVDLVIDRVLGAEGDVIFVPPGSIGEWKRIVLLLREEHPQRPTWMSKTKPPS